MLRLRHALAGGAALAALLALLSGLPRQAPAPPAADARRTAAGTTDPPGRLLDASPALPEEERRSRGAAAGRAKARSIAPATDPAVAPVHAVFPVASFEGEPPAEGALALRYDDPSPSAAPIGPPGRANGREIVLIDFPPDGRRQYVRIGDSHLAVLRIDPARGPQPAHLRRPRALDVHLRDGAGHPVPGLAVCPVRLGVTPMAPPVVTDEEGRARFDGLFPEHVELTLAAPGAEGSPARVGSADLAAGDAEARVVLGDALRVDALVTLDGRPGIPDGLDLVAEGALVVDEVREGPRVGFRLRGLLADRRPHLVARAPDCAPIRRPLPPHAGPTPLPLRLDLVRGASLTLVATPAERCPVDVRLERRAGDGFELRPGPIEEELDDGGLRLTARALPPGDYRFRDLVSGATSPPVLIDGAGPREVALDLGALPRVRGRAVGPPDRDLSTARIEVLYLDRPERFATSIGVDADGAFALPIADLGRRVLSVRHPELGTDAEGGRAVVDGPADGLLLALTEPSLLRFRLPGSKGEVPVAVVLRSEGRPPLVRHAIVRGGVGELARVPPGTFSLFFDAPGAAPLLLEDVGIGPDLTDLGELVLPRGTTATVAVPEGAERWVVTATRLDGPPYRRGAVAADGEARIEGLGPGRFRLSAAVPLSSREPCTRVVEVDGLSPIDLTLP